MAVQQYGWRYRSDGSGLAGYREGRWKLKLAVVRLRGFEPA